MSLAMIGQFLLSLSLLIVLHECGHFFPAKWFKTRVEKFYLFFDPYFSLFKKKIGDTEYGIGWLPLGGYVKISGMVDESMDTAQLQSEPQPWEFRSKKAWQRLIIMIGGVTVNFVLGFLIIALMLWHWGEDYVPAENVKTGIVVDSLGTQLGLKTGDKIVSVGGKTFEKFDPRWVSQQIIFNNANTIEVERGGVKTTVNVPDYAINMLTKNKNQNMALFIARRPFTVDTVLAGKPSEAAGLKKGDRVIGVDSLALTYYDEFVDMMRNKPQRTVALKVVRQNDTLAFNIPTDTAGKIGLGPNFDDEALFGSKHISYSLAQAFPLGIQRGVKALGSQISAFGLMFKGKIEAKESVGGFKSIAKMFGNEWDWRQFWSMTASLSLILAFMNLLPIPALDGGYVVFLLWEVVTGRKVSDKFMEKAVSIGFIFLLGMIILINFWDIIR